jgi:hypothetical protein
MAWHARGQGFKSPQLHPRSEAQIGPSRLQIPRLGQQIGSNPCCLGGSGRPARRQRRPASPPGNGHIRPPAATLTLQRSTGSVGARQIDSSRGNDLILNENRPCTNWLCRTRAELGRAGPILIPRGGPRPWESYQGSAPGLVSPGKRPATWATDAPLETAGDHWEPLGSDGVWTKRGPTSRHRAIW